MNSIVGMDDKLVKFIKKDKKTQKFISIVLIIELIIFILIPICCTIWG